jgi:hypothetical protein
MIAIIDAALKGRAGRPRGRLQGEHVARPTGVASRLTLGDLTLSRNVRSQAPKAAKLARACVSDSVPLGAVSSALPDEADLGAAGRYLAVKPR